TDRSKPGHLEHASGGRPYLRHRGVACVPALRPAFHAPVLLVPGDGSLRACLRPDDRPPCSTPTVESRRQGRGRLGVLTAAPDLGRLVFADPAAVAPVVTDLVAVLWRSVHAFWRR